MATGDVLLTQTDLRLDGVLPLILSRTHVSSYRVGRMFGPSWTSTLDQRLEVDRDGASFAAADGMLLRYPVPASGGEPAFPAAGPRLALTEVLYGYQITDVVRGQTLSFTRPGPQPREGVASWLLTTVTDRVGNRFDLDYDETGVVTGVRHSGGYHVLVDSARGRVTALRLADPDGPARVISRFRYDDRGQLTEVVNSSGESLVFEYDVEGRLISWQDRIGGWHRFDYDADGRCVRTTGAERMLERRLSYDRVARATTVTDSLGHTSVYVFNQRNKVLRRTDELGRVTVMEWDGRDQLLSLTDPLGRTTAYRYDEDGNLTTVVRPDGSTIALTYNELRLPTSVTGADQTVRRLEYDPGGNLTAAIDETGAVTRYGYERYGRLALVTDPTGARAGIVAGPAGLPVEVVDPAGGTTRYERDPFGRPVRITDPIGGTTELAWTVEGRPTWRRLPDGATELRRYDAEGNLVEQVDAIGGTRQQEIGPFGLVTARTEPDGTRFEFAYDTELRLTGVTNPQGLVWRYEYDPAGQMVAETDFNGHTVRYEYDLAGQMVARTNSAGQRLAFRHDPLGNVVERRSEDGITMLGYDPAGRITHGRNADAEVSFEFDAAGRVVADTCNGATVASAYDAAGRRVHRRTPSGAEAAWAYDGRGLPVMLRTAGHAISFTHDLAGRETGRRLDVAVDLAQTWDASHHLVVQSLTPVASGAPEIITQRQWSYRPDGRPTGVEDEHGPRRFALDPAGRVTAVHGGNWTETYAYDPAGNLTDAAWPEAGAGTLAADSQGTREYTGTLITRAGRVRYEHDECGRVVLRQQKRLSGKPLTWRYTWNAEDRLTSVTTPEGTVWRYRYDALGRRIAKQRLDSTGTVTEQVDFRWDGLVLAEQAGHHPDAPDATTVWDYAPGSFRPLAQTERTAVRDAPQEIIDQRFYAIVTDLVGAPTELVDPDGGIAWRRQPTLWGGTVAVAGIADCPLRFPGQYHDPESGEHYNVHRYYDPTTARYHSPDPLGLTPAPNPHTYVPNPHTAIDPLGLDPGGPSRPEGAGDDDVFIRFGTSWESGGRLSRQAEQAEATGRFPHGVSVITPEYVHRANNPNDVSTATRREIEDAGFTLHPTPTRNFPDHHTLELPKPVTSEVANLFNRIFGRSR